MSITPISNTDLYPGLSWATVFTSGNQSGIYAINSTTATGTLFDFKNYSTSVELLCCSTDGIATVYANGVAATGIAVGSTYASATWITVLSGAGTLTSIAVESIGTQRGILFQIRVDGTQLIDLNPYAPNDLGVIESLIDLKTNIANILPVRSSLSIIGTTFEPVSQGEAVYMRSSDGKLGRAASNSTVELATVIGFARETKTTGQLLQASFAGIQGTTGLTPGSIYFLSASSPGAIVTTAPSTSSYYITRVGKAVTSTQLAVDLEPPILLT